MQTLARVNQEELEEKDENIENDKHRGRGSLSCLSCEAPNCTNPKICHRAVRCYTAHVRDVHGVEEKSKGCVKNHQHNMFMCSIKTYDGKNVHVKQNRSAQYAFTCCKETMCNENYTFPKLPDVPILSKLKDLFFLTASNVVDAVLRTAIFVLFMFHL